ncbi:MAG: hypothetical protein AAFN27_16755 [Pseudomonadota bacterium]
MSEDLILGFVGNGITGLGLFAGIVAGAMVQVLVGVFERHRQRSHAKQVILGELIYNHGLIERVSSSVARIKSLAAAHGVLDYEISIDMRQFDYSSITVLMNTGWYYILLNENQIRSYTNFRLFFNENEAMRWNDVWRGMLRSEEYAEIVSMCDNFEEIAKDHRRVLESIYKDLSGRKLNA